jgi:uncharacterized ferritin-like protein (DUF455 family)
VSQVPGQARPQPEAKSPPRPDWSPFALAPAGERGLPPRSIDTPEGIGDRLRAAAFAELQALHAFRWAADAFVDAPAPLRQAWRGLALAEERHLHWLLRRMRELGIDPAGRPVAENLWIALTSCKTAKDFAFYMATAEDRGRQAGERFHRQMMAKDPVSAEIFGKIAEEEVAHIKLAAQWFDYGDRHTDCSLLTPWNRVPHRGPEV